jgi:nucleotide-binding universal stress UspA family protein
MIGQTIVVGVGGTDASWQTLAWAVSDAGVGGARLLVCHVCPPDSTLAVRGPNVPMSILELADPPLARAISAARDRLGGHRVELAIAHGHVGEALVSAAVRADLVVVGAPPRAGWAGRGSTAHYVIAHAPCPTAVVRPVTSQTHGPFATHVVVGVDGSAAGRAALQFGFEYAGVHRKPLAAVHVSAHARKDVSFDEATLDTHLGRGSEGMEMLADEVRPWSQKFPWVAIRYGVFGGRPLTGLLRAAAGAHVLVVGNRGHGPAIRALLGSVSLGVVDSAHCPVVVTRADWPTPNGTIDPRYSGRAALPSNRSAGVE